MSGGKYSNCSHLDTTLPFCVDKPVRFIIRLLFGFASDSVFDKLNQYTNTETAMLSTPPPSMKKNHFLGPRGPFRVIPLVRPPVHPSRSCVI